MDFWRKFVHYFRLLTSFVKNPHVTLSYYTKFVWIRQFLGLFTLLALLSQLFSYTWRSSDQIQKNIKTRYLLVILLSMLVTKSSSKKSCATVKGNQRFSRLDRLLIYRFCNAAARYRSKTREIKKVWDLKKYIYDSRIYGIQLVVTRD